MIQLVEILSKGLRDRSGAVLSGGTVTSFDARTSNRKSMYADRGLTTALSNPLTLDSAGRAVAYASNKTRLIIKDSRGQLVQFIDILGLGNGDVDANDLGSLILATRKIADGSGTSAKQTLSDLPATKLKALPSISQAKLDSSTLSWVIGSASTGAFDRTNTDYGDVTNAQVAITPSKAKVRVRMIPDGSANPSLVGYTSSTGTTHFAEFRLKRTVGNTTEYVGLHYHDIGYGGGVAPASVVPPGILSFLDEGATPDQENTYQLEAKSSDNTNATAHCHYAKIAAREVF